jgi:hypothetical protein
MLGHYQGTLKDLNKVDIFEPNDAIALQMWCTHFVKTRLGQN